MRFPRKITWGDIFQGAQLLYSIAGGSVSGWIASHFVDLGLAWVIGLLCALVILVSIILYKLTPAKTGFVIQRKELEKYRPIQEQLKSGNAIRGCWVTGLDIFQRNQQLLKSGSLKRLILPHPLTPYLDDLRISLGAIKDSVRYSDDIVSVSKMAQGLGIPIRWYPYFCGMSFLLGEEEQGEKSWGHIETVFPYIQPNERLVIVLEKENEPEALAELSEVFDKMWDASREPNYDAIKS